MSMLSLRSYVVVHVSDGVFSVLNSINIDFHIVTLYLNQAPCSRCWSKEI